MKVFWSTYNSKIKHIAFTNERTLCDKNLVMMNLNFLEKRELKNDEICPECLRKSKKINLISEEETLKRIKSIDMNKNRLSEIPFSKDEIDFLKIKILNFYNWNSNKSFLKVTKLLDKINSKTTYLVKSKELPSYVKNINHLKIWIKHYYNIGENYKNGALKAWSKCELRGYSTLSTLEKAFLNYYKFLSKRDDLKEILNDVKLPF